MKVLRAGGGPSVARQCQPQTVNAGWPPAATPLNGFDVLIASAALALYVCFGELHGQGTSSRALAAVLFSSPLMGGVVLGLRGHVSPLVIHVTCGAANAIAAILPLIVVGPESRELLRMPWLSVAQIISVLGVVALGAGLSSFAGAELGASVQRWRRQRAAGRRSAASARSSPRAKPPAQGSAHLGLFWRHRQATRAARAAALVAQR